MGKKSRRRKSGALSTGVPERTPTPTPSTVIIREKKLVSEFTDRLPSNNTKQSNWSSWIFDSILNPTQQLFSSRSQEKITPPKFNPYERVVIGPNDVVPSLAGTLGYVADPEQRPPRPGHAAVCVYAVDVPIYLPEEVLAKPGSIISSPEGPLAGLSNLQFGDVVLIHGLKTEDRSWINHVEGVVSVVAHGVPSRYGVDIPDQNGDLKRFFFKECNLELLFRFPPYLVAPALPDKKVLEAYPCMYHPHLKFSPTEGDRTYNDDREATEILCEPADERDPENEEVPDIVAEMNVMAALKTLKKFPFHADSYRTLGWFFSNGPPQMRCNTTAQIMFLRAVECAKILHPMIESGFQTIEWGEIHARPYIRARQGLALHFAGCGDYSSAVQEGMRLLKVNPNNRIIRMRIVHWYISDGFSRSAEIFLQKYCSKEELHDPTVAYGTVLVNFIKYQIVDEDMVSEDWHPELVKSLKLALELNSFVPEYLLAPNDPDETINYYSLGSREEAIEYAQMARKAWRVTLGALDWLSLSINRSKEKIKKKTKTALSRSAFVASDFAAELPSTQKNNSHGDTSSYSDIPTETPKQEAPLAEFAASSANRSQSKTNQYANHDNFPMALVGKKRVNKIWFDALRDDPICSALLGEWGDDKAVNIRDIFLTGPDGAPKISEEHDLDAKSKLQLVCQKIYKSPPTYKLLSEKMTENNQTIFETQVYHENNDNVKGLGFGSSKKKSQIEAAKIALLNMEMENAEIVSPLTTSLRAAASPLPFPIRFQLERCILGTDVFPLRITRQPTVKKTEREELKKREKKRAKELLTILIKQVIPPLLSTLAHFSSVNDLTLLELFAKEIWRPLCEVKEEIQKPKGFVRFGLDIVNDALLRARHILQQREETLGVSEADLSDHNRDISFEKLKLRAQWPMAEYRCTFLSDGRLIPTGYEMINLLSDTNSTTPQSRRAIREGGWHVRDRFLLIKSLSFHEPFSLAVTKWLEAKPSFCNREYLYLFDKGTGKPDCWLFSPDFFGPVHYQTRQSLLKTLGDFSNVKPSKVGDRIGLAFTQTVPIAKLRMDQFVALPEITCNGYKFSDGCGVMGLNIAKEVQKAFCLQALPGAIQIRIGGIKGMLSLKHNFPPDKIGVRPSMIKYPSNHRILEVKRCAKAKTEGNKLFSQILLILDHLGVPDAVFLDLQKKAFADCLLQFDHMGLDFTQKTHRSIEVEYVDRFLKSHLKTNGERFTAEELNAIKQQMNISKRKANLRCSLFLMLGVIDEHDVLDEGQVLVGNGRIQGPVLICRSPCNSPGDIQRVDAVAGIKDPFFDNLSEVIVFSSKGSRPIPDMLSGGDLDGDEYYVINEPSLVEKLCSVIPQDYGSHSSNLQNFIRMEEILEPQNSSAPDLSCQLEVLHKYLSFGDLVAESADAWVRVADLEGAASEAAVCMAEMHQFALDARKGIVVADEQLVSRMRNILNSYPIPHWRQSGCNSGISVSIQGVLFEHWSLWLKSLELSKQCETAGVEVLNKDRMKQLQALMRDRREEKLRRRKVAQGDYSSDFARATFVEEPLPLQLENLMVSSNKFCAFCFDKALMPCPASKNCLRNYCGTMCASLDWKLDHKNHCGMEEACPICLEAISHPFTLPCLHTFCVSCVRNLFAGGYGNSAMDDDQSMEENVFCPMCRDAALAYFASGKNLNNAKGVALMEKCNTLRNNDTNFYCSEENLRISEKVVLLFKQAIMEQQDIRYVHCNLGSVLMQQALIQNDPSIRAEKVSEAIAVLNEAIRRDINDAKANYFLGCTLLVQDNLVGAIEPLRRAVKCTVATNLNNDLEDILNDYRAALYHALGLKQENSRRPLRFRVGDRVACSCERSWQVGFVSKLWFREKCWPPEHPSSPYQVLLDDAEYLDNYIHAPYDEDFCIRAI